MAEVPSQCKILFAIQFRGKTESYFAWEDKIFESIMVVMVNFGIFRYWWIIIKKLKWDVVEANERVHLFELLSIDHFLTVEQT